MSKMKRYGTLTDVQNARDTRFLNTIRDDFITSLVDELNAAIPGYRDMSDIERFAELMKLNDQHAPNGSFLMLDFGNDESHQPMRSAVYSGRNDLYLHAERDGYKVYDPMFLDSDSGVPAQPTTNITCLLFEFGLMDLYNELPLPFRVAVVVQLIKQNVVVPFVDACRFAAGWSGSLEPARIKVSALECSSGQRFGWSVVMRDTTPENEMGIYIARLLRDYAVADTETSITWPKENRKGDFVPLYTPDKGQTRTRHQSTELLVDFVERDLPSVGKHVTRSGAGEKISWKKAFELFSELHSGLYSSHTSFMNAYYNARKAREGR